MRIEYDLTPEDWAAFGEHCARTAPGFRKTAHVGAVMGMALLLIATILVWQRTGSPFWLTVMLVATVAWGWYWPRTLVAHVRGHMSRHERPCLRGRHALEARPDGLAARCDIAETLTRWAGIQSVVASNDHVFVMLTDVQGYVVPRARIAGGDLDEFVGEADRYVRANRQ